MGVPRSDGFFGKCDPKNKKNYRTRCSALIKTKNENILIDTSPDLRIQMIQNKIKSIDRVLYTHNHADQTHGINDLRVFYLKRGEKIPVYVDNFTKKYLSKNFSYCFKKHKDYPAILKFINLKKTVILNKNLKIKTIPVKHGLINSMSFIINKKIAYLPDANKIYEKDLEKFKKLKYLVIDCLRYSKHPSHFNVNDVLILYKILKPKKMILTNLHSDLDYKTLLYMLPNNIQPAYDGLSLRI